MNGKKYVVVLFSNPDYKNAGGLPAGHREKIADALSVEPSQIDITPIYEVGTSNAILREINANDGGLFDQNGDYFPISAVIFVDQSRIKNCVVRVLRAERKEINVGNGVTRRILHRYV